MYKFKKSLIALAGLLSLVGVIALVTPQTIRSQTESAGPVKPVLVVNSPSEPVPVTGTVSVSNLGGSPLPVRDVDNPARQPYQISNQLPTGNNLVPDGKRFVIEYFSAKALTTADTNCTLASITIKTQTNSSFSPPGAPLTRDHYFTPTPTTTNLSTNYFVVSQQTRLYADPGTLISGDLDFQGSGCAGRINAAFITLSGYLVDVP